MLKNMEGLTLKSIEVQQKWWNLIHVLLLIFIGILVIILNITGKDDVKLALDVKMLKNACFCRIYNLFLFHIA